MADPFLDALASVRQTSDAPDPFLSALETVRQPVDKRSGFSRFFDTLNDPLLPQIATSARQLAETFQSPDLDDSVWMARAKGFAGGALEGAGNLVSGLTSPLGIATTAAGISAPRAAAAGLAGTARALRGAEVAAGAALGGRGLEQMADAESVPEAGLGAVQLAGGLVGVRSGTQGFLRTPGAAVPPPPKGLLPAGPGYVADDTGRVAKFGEAIPMAQAPDGSFVRSVPGAYARREVRGLLPPARRTFEVDEVGHARALEPGDDPFAAAVQQVKRAKAVTSADDTSRIGAADAAIADREFDGKKVVRTIYSGDPQAIDAPLVTMSEPEARELRRMLEEMDVYQYHGRTFEKIPTHHGGDYRVRAGSAGAPVYDDIIGPLNYRPTRGQVMKAMEDYLAGKHNVLGQHAVDVARLRLRRDWTSVAKPILPDDWDGPRWLDESDEVPFGDALDDLAEMPATRATRDPGEEGFIRPELAARIGLGTAGAAYGAATGEDTQDRITRAALFGAAGVAAPSLLKRQPVPGQGVIRTTTTSPAVGPVPPAKPIPAHRRQTMPVLTDEVQGAADDILARYSGFETQRRGVQSVARTEALADQVHVRTTDPLKPGTALNAERMRAYQNTTATLLTKQKRLEQLVKDGKASPADELDLARTKTEADVLTQSFRGAAAEAGRALHILRYQARILQTGDQDAIRAAVDASRQGLAADAQAYFYANILSGIQTHERNVLGNLSNAVYNLAAHPFAVGTDVVRSSATGQPRQVFIGELPEKVAGTIAALPRAFSNALQTLRTGMPRSEVTTYDRPIRSEFRGGGKNPFNYPGRLLDAVDDLFSTTAAEQTLYGAAFAQAKTEGLTGQALLARVAQLKADPSDAVLQEVASQRARLLFRENPGKLAQGILALKRHVPSLGYVVPFVRVPANIIRQGFEASPAGFAMPAARQGGRAGADAMGRAALGTVALAPLAYWAAMGKITGDAPADPAKRAAFYESGKRPNSILIGKTWHNYQTIQPLNVPLAMIANGFQVWQDAQGDPDSTADQIATDAALRTAGSLLDQSFLSGLSALVDALGDPDRYGRRFVQQLATGFVPFSGALRTATQATDSTVRAPQSVAEGIQSNIPGMSQNLPPRLTRFGEPVQRVEGALNVFKPSPIVADPVAQELERVGLNLRPAQGGREMTLGRGVTVPLESDDRLAVGQASGRSVRQILEKVIATNGYQTAPLGAQRMMLEQAVSRARGGVNEQVRRELIRRMQTEAQ